MRRCVVAICNDNRQRIQTYAHTDILSHISCSRTLLHLERKNLPKSVGTSSGWTDGTVRGIPSCRTNQGLGAMDYTDSRDVGVIALLAATQEASFVQSIIAAGIMHTLTRRCSLGHFSDCGCDDTKKGKRGGHNWLWSGCSDNVRFGGRVSKQLIDSLEKGKDALASMKLHNNEVGRMAVRKTMKTVCKCHGVSGSCTTKTCWRQLADFRRIGYYLKKRYSKGLHVNFQDGKLGEWNVASGQGLSSVSKIDLVYLELSPDYCKQNLTLSIKGTLSRECKRPNQFEKMSKWERRSCHRLCTDCGYQIHHWTEDIIISCQCKFFWCCAVKCKQCLVKSDKYSCKR